MIYFDNAATSWPKPPQAIEAMVHFMEHVGANPGRSGHRLSIEAGRIVYDTREALATLFNVPDPLRIVFGLNVTEALNLALRGILRPRRSRRYKQYGTQLGHASIARAGAGRCAGDGSAVHAAGSPRSA